MHLSESTLAIFAVSANYQY